MPGGRPAKPSVPRDASCISLSLPKSIQCISCKRESRQADGNCRMPWDDRWIETTKSSDYLDAWEHLQKSYKIPPKCRNARCKIPAEKVILSTKTDIWLALSDYETRDSNVYKNTMTTTLLESFPFVLL